MHDPIIALTGATGFIGNHLLHALTRRGHRIRVLLRSPAALPPGCTNAVIGDLNRPINMAAALAGVDTIIHSAGLAPTMTGSPDEDFRRLNTAATGNLAQAAQRAGVRRFIFLSSLRAQADVSARDVLTEDLPPVPTDAYGRSKLAAEQELSRHDLDWVALRLALVFGPGVKGNVARLVDVARSPYWLPFGALRAKRSLLSLDNLVTAVETVMATPQLLRRPLIVADPEPLSIAQMITAMRAGLGRRRGLIPVPSTILHAGFRLMGRGELYRRLAEPLVGDAARLRALGWVPRVTTSDALAVLARSPNHQSAAARSQSRPH
jgi:nucleoside-diphosphate-sugar epimerase